ncbi:ATP-binding protein [Actinoplanes sp. TBRC 11911]|uniref:ATP-binding protein n=1 Tax=Actinoplanes sp. TBRC 11911 TaxID=2729386 RepID=UPI00145F2A3C|nr:ATP-binding protein [Actinoplanes sp. TBRC 11911]NMO55899.1 ATP-binding protein [Actinoplanes sp. TBRC 11911]
MNRRKVFVGRQRERELFAASLSDDRGDGSVLFVQGAGGVGKSALLDVFADDARAKGRAVIRIDGRFVESDPASFAEAVGAVPAGSVLIIDTFERCQGLELWLSRHFLPGLPGDTVVVIAGRRAPDVSWRSDSAWSGLLRVLRLGELDAPDAARLMAGRGVLAALRPRVLAFAGGHPLALTLAAEVARSDVASAETWEPGPDVIGTLLAQLVGEVPSEWHRRALALCAHVEVSTQETVRTVVPADQAGGVFAWLCDQPYIETDPRGVFPHDIVRDVLEAELRWRDAEAYREMHRAVQQHLLDEIRADGNADYLRLTREFAFTFRRSPVISTFFTWQGTDDLFGGPYRPGERATLLAFTERVAGSATARIAGYWMDRQPEAFQVYRRISSGEPVGYSAWLTLTEPDPRDRAADPVVDAVWTHVERTAPPRPGEHVGVSRFLVEAEAYERRSPVMDLMVLGVFKAWLSGDGLAWSFCAAGRPDHWRDGLAGLQHRSVLPYPRIDREPVGLFACDWRRTPVEPWLDWLSVQALRGRATGSPPPRPDVDVLGRAEFADAVRFALRVLHGTSLGDSVLLRSRLVNGSVDRRLALRDRILAEIREIGADPREAKVRRVLDATYVRPAPTQEAAAGRLNLPFTTYRRHLTRGIQLLTERLWQQELNASVDSVRSENGVDNG